MGLADLWDNLKQPGFIPSAIDDMKDLAGELKDIVVDFIEEADCQSALNIDRWLLEKMLRRRLTRFKLLIKSIKRADSDMSLSALK